MAVFAALREQAFDWKLRMTMRGDRFCTSGVLAPVLATVLGLATAFGVATTTPAAAQSFTYNRPATRPKPPPAAQTGQMLVQATEVNYDYNNSRVAAVGSVQMYYNGTSVGSRQGHLRPEDQAPARRRQCPHDGRRRQDHLC